MVMTVDSTSNNHSPRSPGDGINSPQFRQQNSSPPWAQVVRGEPETISAVPRSPSSPSSSMTKQTAFPDSYASKTGSTADNTTVAESQLENSDSNNSKVDRTTRTVWNKPLNGVIDVSPVMGGAGSWPALSESTRPKPSPDSSKPILDGSVSISQVPVISHSPPKQVNTSANRNFSPNPTLPARQRSMKGSGGGSAQSNFTRLPPPPPPPPPPPLPPPPPPPLPLPLPLPQPFPPFELPYSTLVSPREPPYKSNYWESRPIGGFFSKSHAGNDHPSQRNSSRRGNFGHRPRGDGSHHNSYGSRRDHDRDWRASRSSNVRDVPHQTPPPRSSMRHPPPSSTPFITPQPVGPFGNPMSFDMRPPFIYLPSESFRGVPFVPPMSPPPMFFPVSDPSLPGLLLNQIDYYFSDDNLVKDNFLKSNMDDQGWVPITLIAGFPRVQHLTCNIQLILDSLRASTVVELQGDKVRRRNEWRKWIPASGQFPTDSGSHSPSVSGYNILATSVQKVTLDEVSINCSSAMGKADPVTEAAPGRHSSEELAGQSKLANGKSTDEEA